jgi:hypothetical protein
VLKRFDKLFNTLLLRKIRSLLQLTVLLYKPLVKLRQLGLHVILDVFLLVAHNLEDFVVESDFSLLHKFL